MHELNFKLTGNVLSRTGTRSLERRDIFVAPGGIFLHSCVEHFFRETFLPLVLYQITSVLFEL
jgi:hypothetical protein